jgi:hypothetical protein
VAQADAHLARDDVRERGLAEPGGPNSSTWSSASLRFLAASMKTVSWPRIFSWPTYSSSTLGRSVRSRASSCGEAGAAAMRRSLSIIRNA